MTDFATVRFVDFREAEETSQGIDRRLTPDQIPRRGGSFLLFPGTAPVRIVAARLSPNADSGAHWVILYRTMAA